MATNIKQWSPKMVTLPVGEVFTYNPTNERTNIFQIINRVASGGGGVCVDVIPQVSNNFYQMSVQPGSSQNLVLPVSGRPIYLWNTASSPLTIEVIEIESDNISYTFGASQLVNISGNVQVAQPVNVSGTVAISGEVEVKNDTGNPLPVTIQTIPEVEIKNDTGNPIPVTAQSTPGTVLNVASAAITATTNSADLSVGMYRELAIDVNLSALSGTTPGYQLIIQRKGVDGVYYPIYTGNAQTAAGTISLSLGMGGPNNIAFGNIIRLVETISGTTPSITRSISIIGK